LLAISASFGRLLRRLVRRLMGWGAIGGISTYGVYLCHLRRSVEDLIRNGIGVVLP
jgi:hypothetical protein